jgi:catechol 2,3-dioxygenase-like lactoylglutathione lyase family enzyme
VVVTDMDRAIRFYDEVFGFTVVHRAHVKPVMTSLSQAPELESEICFMALGDRQIELVHSVKPETNPVPVDRPLFRVGIGHMSFMVTGLDHWIARIEAAGGQVLHDTRVDTPQISVILADDPFGVRLEMRETYG